MSLLDLERWRDAPPVTVGVFLRDGAPDRGALVVGVVVGAAVALAAVAVAARLKTGEGP